MDDPVAKLAAERFGVPYLFPLQRMVVGNILDAALEGAERPPLRQLVLLPTGFGKSLCFQLPALMAPGITLVIYPLLALMQDQRRRLEQCGIPNALFRGGMEKSERAAQETLVRNGAKIVIANPEILATPRLLSFLGTMRISHIAIDEAHCVSEWGRSFRPSYLEVGRIVRALDPPAVSAFTATASPDVAGDITRIVFGGDEPTLIAAVPDRPNIHYAVVRSLCPERSMLGLVGALRKPLIVFCASRDGVQIAAERIAARLGLDTRFYHAGLEKSEKRSIEDWFMDSADGVLVSTCAYGMGVDKKNIRSVVHYGPAASVEAYLQEAGRAGRDGEPSRAVLVVGDDEDGPRAGADSNADDEADSFAASRRAALFAYARERGCRRENLLRRMGSDAIPACSGCDACDGSASDEPEGWRELARFFRANGRRFDLDGAARMLGSAWDSTAAGRPEPPACRGSGLLADWSERERRMLIGAAVRKGLLAAGSDFPWKGRIWMKNAARRGGGGA